MQTNIENNPCHPASPYFIQPDEGASFPLVPNLLTMENYVTWLRTMSWAFNIKKKLDFIGWNITKSANVSDPLSISWECCNGHSMDIALISLEHRLSIAHVNSIASV